MTLGWDRELIQAYIDFDAAYRREQSKREPDRAVCDACGWEGTEDERIDLRDVVTVEGDN